VFLLAFKSRVLICFVAPVENGYVFMLSLFFFGSLSYIGIICEAHGSSALNTSYYDEQ